MPSPFPGMDPYLEGALWTTVHFSLSAEMVRQLAPKLRPRYLVLPAERFVMETPESVAITAADMYPDVGVAQARSGAVAAQGTTIAAAPLELATVIPTPIPHVTIEIRDTAHRQLVTAMEVLSPTHKRGDGRQEYLAKRRRILLSTAHLLEIDLLRQGQRVPMQKPLPAAPYFIFLSRAEKRPITEIWPIRLSAPLPVVPVPLLPGDQDVALDLQQTFTTTYDLLGYDLALDYTQPPDIPLLQEDVAWVERLLRTAGGDERCNADPLPSCGACPAQGCRAAPPQPLVRCAPERATTQRSHTCPARSRWRVPLGYSWRRAPAGASAGVCFSYPL